MNFDSSTGKKVSLSKLFNQPVVRADQRGAIFNISFITRSYVWVFFRRNKE